MSIVSWVLKIAVFGTFLGHGMVAFNGNPSWLHYLTFWGFSTETAQTILPVIGVVDILIAVSVIIKPLRPVLLYAVAWAFGAALMRWLADGNVLGFVERAANWGAPLALFFIGRKK